MSNRLTTLLTVTLVGPRAMAMEVTKSIHDDDIDIYDQEELEWTVALRVRADRDLLLAWRQMREAEGLDRDAEGRYLPR
jgi:UbiD family decarboxylase